MTAPLSTADLLEGLAAKKRYKYVFFWGDTPRRDGVIDNSCLSQWSSAPFIVDGVRYRTAEHWMMAGKARLFGDAAAEATDERAEHPAQWRGLNLLGFALMQARQMLAGSAH